MVERAAVNREVGSSNLPGGVFVAFSVGGFVAFGGFFWLLPGGKLSGGILKFKGFCPLCWRSWRNGSVGDCGSPGPGSIPGDRPF